MSHLDEKIPVIDTSYTELEQLRFFQTHAHTCSYLPGKRACTVFLDPQQHIDQALYSRLSVHGFRRSGQHVYKPHCAQCNACVPMRIPVQLFQPNRQQQRCWKRNGDVTVQKVLSIDSKEHYQLYANYIEVRHADGDMYPPSREQFTSFLADRWSFTHYYEFRTQQNKLIAISVADKLDNGISAIYSFFDPSESKRSLGTFIILWLVEEAKYLGLPAVYLGYWIEESSKMNYKANFRPLELLEANQWRLAT